MRSNRCSSSVWVLCLWILAAIGVTFAGCGGGGGGGGGGGSPPVATATIQGSVSGTIIMAIDETGKIAAKDDTAGKTPVNGKYPFTLTVPVGHQYTIQFIVTDNATGEERVVPLYENTINIFSVASTGTLDLGFVDTSAVTAASDNNLLTQSGVTSGGTTPAPTIKLQGYRYLYTRNGPTGIITAKFHVEVRDPGGTTPVTDPTLVKDVKIYANTWMELPLDGKYVFWNGTDGYFDSSGTIALLPQADLEGVLQAAPSSLAAGFYNVVVTDNAGNLHNAKVYFRQPDVVNKPLLNPQTINTDNSITFTWTNPTFPAGAQYHVNFIVYSDDLNGDGVVDTLLHVRRLTPMNTYTIPADFVASQLAGKSGLKWQVQIRQYDNTIVFPDGSNPGIGTQFYRNYSAESTLTLSSAPVAFTQADLTGTWDTVQFVNGTGHGWYRGTATVDDSGNIAISNLETSGGTPPSTTGIRWTLDSSGVVVETVNSIATPFHGTMSSSKDLVVGVQSVSGSSSLIRIARKRVAGVTYGIADLAAKSFIFHGTESGDFTGWFRGTGTIDGTGQIRLTTSRDEIGPTSPPVDPSLVVGQFQIDGSGIVQGTLGPEQIKGFLTSDKTTMFLVYTSIEGTLTSYRLLAISLVNPAKVFSLTDLEGTFRGNAIWTGTTSTQNGWGYFSLVLGAAGSGTVSGTEPAGSFTALPTTVSISSNGTLGLSGAPTFDGILSPNDAMQIATVTDGFGYGEFSLQILVK